MDVFLDGSRRLRFGAVVGLASAAALLMSLLFAGTAAASHVVCGQTITEDTTLDSDLNCSGAGLIIGADNVTLDLNGHTVSGDPQARALSHEEAAGILFAPRVSGSTVRNGTVENFDAGVVVRGGSGNAIRDLTVRDNINYRVVTGVDADPAPGNSCDYGDGIALFNADNNVIENNQVIHNGPLSGISLVEDSDSNLISRNVVADNDVVNRTPDGRNTVCGTGSEGEQGPMRRGRTVQDIGIRIEGPGADDNRVERNEVTGNGLAGIAIHGYVCTPPEGFPGGPADNNGGNLIFKNNVSGTGQDTSDMDAVADGIAILQQGPAEVVCVAHSNTIKNNVSSDNERHGIFMGGRGSHDNNVINNRVNDNAGDGLHVTGPFTRESTGRTFPGAINNNLLANKGSGNDGFDGFDGNPDCDNNQWRGSKFVTVNQECVRGPGTGQGRR
ncbi:MAG: right-handed parallel beta-helix repeat-containing protein [Actinomycetota bacterium]|nr:right-handed parallel beta-helix repeat-containing protein [Actinomycetota bacterium]